MQIPTPKDAFAPKPVAEKSKKPFVRKPHLTQRPFVSPEMANMRRQAKNVKIKTK